MKDARASLRPPLLLFSLLYFVQGAAMAYFSNFQKPYLKGLGIDADSIALLTTLLLMPFVLKIFFGMASDRFPVGRWGKRKPYMFAGLLIGMAGFGLCSAYLPDNDYAAFSILIVMASFGVALFDAATDGFAIDVTPPAESGRVQSFMVGGRAAGVILLSLVFGQIAGSLGYRWVFLAIAGLLLVPFAWVALMRPRAPLPDAGSTPETAPRSGLKALISARFGLFCAYAVVYSFVSFGIDGLIPFSLSESHGLGPEALGSYGAARGVGAILGAVAFAGLFRWMGLRRGSIVSLALLGVGAAGVAISLGPSNYVAVAIGWGAIWALQETCFVTLAMEESRHGYSGAIFAFLMALSNVGTAIGEGFATSLTDDTSFTNLFLILGAFAVIPIGTLWLRNQLAGR